LLCHFNPPVLGGAVGAHGLGAHRKRAIDHGGTKVHRQRQGLAQALGVQQGGPQHLGRRNAAERPHRARLDFAEPQFSVAPGQAAVFYCDDVLLGGGLIQADG
jgi:tRNA U34 2-thiouridine synthase MnmA/TrmU